MLLKGKETVLQREHEPWEQNEDLDEEQELVATEHRDDKEPNVTGEEELSMETTEDDPSRVLDEFGEDVASSAAERNR